MKKLRCSCGKRKCPLGSFGHKFDLKPSDRVRAQLEDDLFLYGAAYATRTGERIDPRMIGAAYERTADDLQR